MAGDAALTNESLEEATHHYTQALQLARKSNDSNRESIALNQLGMLAERRGDLVDARNHYQRALDLQHNPSDEVAIRLNLASVSMAENELDQAQGDAARALSLAEANDDDAARGLAHRYLGQVCSARNEIPQARSHFNRSVWFFVESRLRVEEAGSRLALGRLELQAGRPKRAIPELSQARGRFHSGEDVRGEALALSLLADSYEQLDDPGSALAFRAKEIELLQKAPELEQRLTQALQAGIRLEQATGGSRHSEQWLRDLASIHEPSR